MTLAKNGTIVMPKSRVEFLMDLTLILRSGFEHGLITKEDVDHAWELATTSNEELRKKAEEKMGSMISDLAGLVGADAAGEILRAFINISKEEE